jgi:HSP20 family protein
MYLTTATRRGSDALQSLRRLNTLLDEAFAPWPLERGENGAITAAWTPPCDIFENPEAVKIVVELPGVKPEDVNLSIENNLLTIRGEKRQAAEEQTERVHRYERTYGAFERAFALPNTVDPDRVEAQFENGLLFVTLPKAERARPREIKVKAS